MGTGVFEVCRRQRRRIVPALAAAFAVAAVPVVAWLAGGERFAAHAAPQEKKTGEKRSKSRPKPEGKPAPEGDNSGGEDQGKADRGSPPAATPQDEIVLVDDKTLRGTLLDTWGAEYVVATPEGKRFLPKSEVKHVTRFLSVSRIAAWTKNAGEFKDADKLKRFASFLREKQAFPEERLCWRRILELTPDNEEAKRALGQRPLNGTWLSEKETHAKLADGHKEVNGELVQKSPVTVVSKESKASGEATGKGSSKAGKKTSTRKPNFRDIKAVDHLALVLEDKDEHSLWMLLKRSGIPYVVGREGPEPVNIKTCKSLIESLSEAGKDYKKEMTAYLKAMNAPRDWKTVNAKVIGEFKEKHAKGIHLETKHYHILSTASPELTKELGHNMDIVVDQVYHKIFEFEEKIETKYILRFWKNRSEFVKNGASPQAAAYFAPTTKQLVGYDLKADGTSAMDTFQTLYHEGWHQYFDFYIPDAPRWYDEGFAEVISPTVVKGNKAIRSGYNRIRSSDVGQAASRGALIPLRDLIKMSHEEMYNPSHIQLAYAQSWSFVYFLTNYTSSDKKVQEKVRNFYKDYFWELHKGTDFVEAVDIVFKEVKFDTLEQAWIKAIPHQK